MYSLSDEQMEFILHDLQSRGIFTEDLLSELLDHVCILIENNLDQEESFEEYYYKVIVTFFNKSISEIELERDLLLTYRPYLILTRTQFGFLLLFLVIMPFLIWNLTEVINNWSSSGWSIPDDVWGASVAYSLWPILTILVIFLTPDNMDPLISKGSRIIIGIKSLIRIIKPIDVGEVFLP